MTPDFLTVALLDNLTAVVVLSAVALSVITDKLVWHTRLKKAEARAERWEAIALEALNFGAQVGVKAAEVTTEVIAAFPSPARPSASEPLVPPVIEGVE